MAEWFAPQFTAKMIAVKFSLIFVNNNYMYILLFFLSCFFFLSLTESEGVLSADWLEELTGVGMVHRCVSRRFDCSR